MIFNCIYIVNFVSSYVNTHTYIFYNFFCLSITHDEVILHQTSSTKNHIPRNLFQGLRKRRK